MCIIFYSFEVIDFQHTTINEMLIESKCSQLKRLLWHHITHCIDSDVQQRRKTIIQIPLSQGELGSQIKYQLYRVTKQLFRSMHTLDFARHTTYKNYLRHVKNSVSITLQEKLLQVSRVHNACTQKSFNSLLAGYTRADILPKCTIQQKKQSLG